MENDKYIGRLLGGRYELIDVVGVGGMAVVYRARDTVLGRYVAIKILKEEFAKDPDIRKRFAIESRAVAKLSHHNIVSVYDVGNEDGTDYIVMELIEGVTLKEYLRRRAVCRGRRAFSSQNRSRAPSFMRIRAASSIRTSSRRMSSSCATAPQS